MDQSQRQCSNGCLVPRCLTENIEIKLDLNKNIIDTFKQIERNHWDYLDNYRDVNRRRYPTLSIQQFTSKLFQVKGIPATYSGIQDHLRVYNRYKKSVPTAGVIFYHHANFVVVRMRFSKIWSMPKGKKEPDEHLGHTAQREFREETGIDLDDCLHADTTSRMINKTCFYLVESDYMHREFNGFNCKEVDAVKWVNAHTVAENTHNYSKQTVSVAKHLLELDRCRN
jgi:8-oxo-dGTP pyrophosphatase MutT (NUDIX family)